MHPSPLTQGWRYHAASDDHYVPSTHAIHSDVLNLCYRKNYTNILQLWQRYEMFMEVFNALVSPHITVHSDRNSGNNWRRFISTGCSSCHATNSVNTLKETQVQNSSTLFTLTSLIHKYIICTLKKHFFSNIISLKYDEQNLIQHRFSSDTDIQADVLSWLEGLSQLLPSQNIINPSKLEQCTELKADYTEK